MQLATDVASIDFPSGLNGFQTRGRAAIADGGAADYTRETVTEVADFASLPGTADTAVRYYTVDTGIYYKGQNSDYWVDPEMGGALRSNDGSHWQCQGSMGGLQFTVEMMGDLPWRRSRRARCGSGGGIARHRGKCGRRRSRR